MYFICVPSIFLWYVIGAMPLSFHTIFFVNYLSRFMWVLVFKAANATECFLFRWDGLRLRSINSNKYLKNKDLFRNLKEWIYENTFSNFFARFDRICFDLSNCYFWASKLQISIYFLRGLTDTHLHISYVLTSCRGWNLLLISVMVEMLGK